MRHITQNGLNLIKRFEGFSRNFYFCPAAYPTIGYGHVVKDDEDFTTGIDEAQAEELLREDAQIAERAVLSLINVPLTDCQLDAPVSFTCNLGGGAIQLERFNAQLCVVKSTARNTPKYQNNSYAVSGRAAVNSKDWFGDVLLKANYINISSFHELKETCLNHL